MPTHYGLLPMAFGQTEVPPDDQLTPERLMYLLRQNPDVAVKSGNYRTTAPFDVARALRSGASNPASGADLFDDSPRAQAFLNDLQANNAVPMRQIMVPKPATNVRSGGNQDVQDFINMLRGNMKSVRHQTLLEKPDPYYRTPAGLSGIPLTPFDVRVQPPTQNPFGPPTKRADNSFLAPAVYAAMDQRGIDERERKSAADIEQGGLDRQNRLDVAKIQAGRGGVGSPWDDLGDTLKWGAVFTKPSGDPRMPEEPDPDAMAALARVIQGGGSIEEAIKTASQVNDITRGAVQKQPEGDTTLFESRFGTSSPRAKTSKFLLDSLLKLITNNDTENAKSTSLVERYLRGEPLTADEKERVILELRMKQGLISPAVPQRPVSAME